MIKQIKNKLGRKNKKGFTLIELIVVIAIVAVLAAVGIPAIAGQVGKSNQAAADSTAKLLAEQASIMYTEQETSGAAPTALTEAAVCSAAGVKTADFTTITIVSAPVTDAAGATIAYKVTGVTVVKSGKTGTFTRT